MADSKVPLSQTLEELVNRPLAEIARELEILRQQNARMKQDVDCLSGQIDVLTPALARAKHEVTVFRAAIKTLIQDSGFLQPFGQQQRPHAAVFPPEIVLRILKATHAPPYEHDPSALRPRNPWLREIRFRKGLVLVCKAWSWPATAALYEDIVLWRMGQISALARTLSEGNSAGNRLAVLVQRLRLDACVVWAPFSDAVRTALTLLLGRCTALRAFAFRPHPNFANAVTPSEIPADQHGFNPAWFLQGRHDDVRCALEARVAAGLLELDLAMTLKTKEIQELHAILESACPGLRTLTLGPIDAGTLAGSLDRLRNIELLALEELDIYIDKVPFATYVSSTWKLPRLTSLTVRESRDVPFRFLEAHGKHLVYLHFPPAWKERTYDYSWPSFATEGLKNIGTLSPKLTHLVVPLTPSALGLPTSPLEPDAVQSPTLRFLDFWCHKCLEGNVALNADCDKRVSSGALPALERVRHLRKIPRSDLPRICHPEMISGDAVRLVRFAGSVVVQTAWCITPDSGIWQDVPWFEYLHSGSSEGDSNYRVESTVYSPEEEENEDDDEEVDNYEPQEFIPETESESGTDWGVSDEEPDAAMSDWEFDGTATQEWAGQSFDQDTMLEMFAASHECSHLSSDEDADEMEDFRGISPGPSSGGS